MNRRTMILWQALALALLVTGCSGSPESPVSPTRAAAGGVDADVNADGSTLKVNAPTNLSPSGGALVGSNQVTLAFAAASGKYVPVDGIQHRVELFNQNGTLIAAWLTGDSSVLTPNLEYQQTYTWRVQPTLDGQVGPWSGTAGFVTPEPPVPAECLRQPLEANRLGCVIAIAATSDEWRRCTGGSGAACHRFTREVARALSIGDPNWGLLGKPPGVWQCTLNGCGTGGGGFGEDIVAYCTGPGSCRNESGPDGRTDWVAIDIVVGAGLPGASIGWSPIPRAFNRGNNFWSPVP